MYTFWRLKSVKFQGLKYELSGNHNVISFLKRGTRCYSLHDAHHLENGAHLKQVRILQAMHIFGDGPLTHLLAIHKVTIFEWDR